MRESRAQVVRLFKGDGVKDSHVSVANHIGYGRLSIKEASVFDNFPNAREDFAYPTLAMFREAIGTYRSRMLEAFSPLYWLETLIHLPREVLGYLGVSAESVFVKAAQIVWWVMGTLLSLLFVLYRPEIRTVISGWLENLGL